MTDLKIYQFDPDLLDCEYPDHCSDRIANEVIEYYKHGYMVRTINHDENSLK